MVYGFVLLLKKRILYHHGSDVLKRKILRNILEAIGWTEGDLKRLKLIK